MNHGGNHTAHLSTRMSHPGNGKWLTVRFGRATLPIWQCRQRASRMRDAALLQRRREQRGWVGQHSIHGVKGCTARSGAESETRHT